MIKVKSLVVLGCLFGLFNGTVYADVDDLIKSQKNIEQQRQELKKQKENVQDTTKSICEEVFDLATSTVGELKQKGLKFIDADRVDPGLSLPVIKTTSDHNVVLVGDFDFRTGGYVLTDNCFIRLNAEYGKLVAINYDHGDAVLKINVDSTLFKLVLKPNNKDIITTNKDKIKANLIKAIEKSMKKTS